MKDGILILNVIHGKEMEIEYKKNEIIDQINAFYGYNCIKEIRLKIVQNKLKEKNQIYSKIKNFDLIKEKMKKVENKHLKYSLNNFLKAFNDKNR